MGTIITGVIDRGAISKTDAHRHSSPDDYLGNQEPPVNELLSDPVVALMAASDGVDRSAIPAAIRMGMGGISEAA